MTGRPRRAEGLRRESVVRHDPRTITEVVDGEAVVYHQGRETIHVLNPTATVVWNLLDGSVSVGVLIEELADVADAERATVEHDVLKGVRHMSAIGLLDRLAPSDDGDGSHPSGG